MLNIQQKVPLSKLTTLEIGGPANEFVEVDSEDQLKETIQYAKEKNLAHLLIGGGSNLLISDDGYPGLVIKNKISGIEVDGEVTKVKSGTTLQELVDFTIEHGLSGANRLTGIPGTVGGAVYGNAGAYGQTISDFLEEVTLINPSVILSEAKDITLSKEDCHFSYRDSNLKNTKGSILEIHFKFPKGDRDQLKRESDETLQKRLLKYKPGIKCPGSFFKNVLMDNLSDQQKKLIPPERDTYGKVPAWFFLDEVGAKGAKKGDVEIADFHGNLFINAGDGTAKDFYDLAKEYQEKVKQKFGLTLEPEVQLINLPPL